LSRADWRVFLPLSLICVTCGNPTGPDYPHEIVAEIYVPGIVNDVCVSPSGDKALVCCDSLCILDLDARSVVGTIPLPYRFPVAVSAHPYDDVAFVSMGEIDSIAVISTVADSVFGYVPVADGSRDVLVLPDASLILSVSNGYPCYIDLIDPDSLAVISRIGPFPSVEALASSPSGDLVFVAVACDSYEDEVVVLSTNPPEILTTIQVDHPSGVVVDQEGDYVYINGSSLFVLRVSDLTIVDSLSTELLEGQLAISAEGDHLYGPAVDWPGDAVGVVDLNALAEVAKISLPSSPMTIASSPTRSELSIGSTSALYVLGL
jgi:DNA-binding beta-propeller fold protein YncE